MSAKSKPKIILDLDEKVASPLKAETYLSRLKPNVSFHEALDCRHPLGIYNVSTTRILKKLIKCCAHLEELLLAAPNVSLLQGKESKQDEVVDYIELCIYAAAEHVDDIEAIANCFFRDQHAAARSRHTKTLKANMKQIRSRISGFANAIKHNQSRIRLLSLDFAQAEGSVCLHGFFVEKFHNGTVCPSPIFHARENVISITSFLWGVLNYLFSMSGALCKFLLGMNAIENADQPISEAALLRHCVIGLARLPLYSFDDTHPFEAVRYVLKGGESARREMDSKIYGSILRRWSRDPIASFGRARMGYEGDGTTRHFQMNSPSQVRIQHWD